MCTQEEKEQMLPDLIEFLKMLDFEKVDPDNVRIVPNFFDIKELPATVQEYLKTYFNYLDSIQ